ncbi:TPA: hypothetical protein H1012_03590 [archaeon]|nr:hypothetical protein [Candidatus Naiadarchaeales archaeon SRR2090153.bin461]HIK02899.1 hypothetical protein [Candidatus Naiadarchaeales archaeon SRR2090159.bin1288]
MLNQNPVKQSFTVSLSPRTRKRLKEGQVPELGTVLIVAVLIVIVVITYTWGKALFDAQKTRTTADYMSGKLFEIKGAILAVAHEGANSSRIVRLDISEGLFSINNGTFCSNKNMDRNSIVFNITTKSRLIGSDTFSSIDPLEANTSCDAPYGNSSVAILMGKSEKAGNSYVNSYTLWFRNLSQPNGASNNFYVINVTHTGPQKLGSGSSTLVVKNLGTINSSFTIYTTVQVDIT